MNDEELEHSLSRIICPDRMSGDIDAYGNPNCSRMDGE
jgi:hypothetical protein